MSTLVRLPAFIAGFVGVAALSWLTTPSVQAILPGDPNAALIVLSGLILSVSARLAILAPSVRMAWGRTSALNGLCCLAVTAFTMNKEPSAANWTEAPILVGLGVGAVVAAAGLVLLAAEKRSGRALQKTIVAEQTKLSDFAPEETLPYRREAGANYRAFVQHVWANAEVSMAPLAAYVDDRPCRIVSVASRPRGGCYVNVILDGVGYALMAHAHRWSTESGPVDVAAWGLNLLATEESSSSRRAVS